MNIARTSGVIAAVILVLVYTHDHRAYKKKASVQSSIVMYAEEMRAWEVVESKLKEFKEVIEELEEQSNALEYRLDNASEDQKVTEEYQKAQRGYSELATAKDSVTAEHKRKAAEYEERKATLLDKYHKAEEEYSSLPHPILFRRNSLPSDIEKNID